MSASSREFRLLGQKIVVSTAAEAELAERAIKIAQQKIQGIQVKAPLLGPQQLAVLALLEMARDVAREERESDRDAGSQAV